jgi:hypothetical protein
LHFEDIQKRTPHSKKLAMAAAAASTSVVKEEIKDEILICALRNEDQIGENLCQKRHRNNINISAEKPSQIHKDR